VQLQFTELALADGAVVRLYSTDTSAEPAQQRSVARALLGFASLSVLIVADATPALLTNGLRPLRESIARGPWPNKDMLVIPLGDSAALAPLVTELPGPSALAVHITPQALQTAQMWAYISNTWNRVGGPVLAGRSRAQSGARPDVRPDVRPVAQVHAQAAAQPAAQPVSASRALHAGSAQARSQTKLPEPADRSQKPPRGSDTTTIPGPLEVAAARAGSAYAMAASEGAATVPISPRAHQVRMATEPQATNRLQVAAAAARPSAPRAMPTPGATPWAAYMRRCGNIKGVVAACVFDAHTGGVMASVGGPVPSPERLALQGMALLTQAGHAARALGVAAVDPEMAISAGQHHLLVRPVPGHPGVALHLMLSADTGSLTLARMHLERLESPA
jgi:hypothetical protein